MANTEKTLSVFDDGNKQPEEPPAVGNRQMDVKNGQKQELESRSTVPPPPPNGGAVAWLQVLASWMLVFNCWGTIVTFGVYQDFYERGTLFQQSSSNISWIGSIQSLLVFGMGCLVGPLYDRGYLKSLILVGAFGLVFGHMMLSLCTEYWQVLLAQGFVVGIGGGCLFVPALAVLQPYFNTRLGLALGAAATGSSIGGIIYPVVFINLIDTAGFAWTTRAIGFIALGTLLIPIAFSKMRVKPAKVRQMVDFTAFRDAPFLLCVLGCSIVYAGSQVAFFYFPLFGQSNGWTTGSLGLYLLPILNTASTFGRVLPNWAADKIGAVNVMVPGCAAIGIVLLCNLAIKNAAGVIVTAIFFGYLSGIAIATPPLLFMVFTKDKNKVGGRMGLAYALLALSVLLGGPAAGAILQRKPDQLDWTGMWVYAGVYALASMGIFILLRVWQRGWKLSAKF